MGGRAAGGSIVQQTQLRQFGMRIGLAFQIADDILDVTEKCEQTGKDSSNDLLNHRLTLPLLRALRLSSDRHRVRLLELLASADASDHARLREEPVLREGVASAQATAEHFVRRALRNLQPFPASSTLLALEGIARFAAHRNT